MSYRIAYGIHTNVYIVYMICKVYIGLTAFYLRKVKYRAARFNERMNCSLAFVSRSGLNRKWWIFNILFKFFHCQKANPVCKKLSDCNIKVLDNKCSGLANRYIYGKCI